jgi:hypothetical protein
MVSDVRELPMVDSIDYDWLHARTKPTKGKIEEIDKLRNGKK